MLTLGGYLNLLIAFGHIIGLFWADEMFEITGIGNEMKKLAIIHFSLPYFLTFFVAILFFIFGIYGLSADNKFKKLPFLKIGIFTIAGIYIFRGLGELIYDFQKQDASPVAETAYSLIALSIGLLFLIGGLRKWNFISKKE